jgi:hypothetical protein
MNFGIVRDHVHTYKFYLNHCHTALLNNVRKVGRLVLLVIFSVLSPVFVCFWLFFQFFLFYLFTYKFSLYLPFWQVQCVWCVWWDRRLSERLVSSICQCSIFLYGRPWDARQAQSARTILQPHFPDWLRGYFFTYTYRPVIFSFSGVNTEYIDLVQLPAVSSRTPSLCSLS